MMPPVSGSDQWRSQEVEVEGAKSRVDSEPKPMIER